ncbi:hypothetical protein MmiEs2_02540 [Methanimicrococcus stummii]|uniref:Transglutaminase-like domain-containing protein n=1 Tax=Methanimicrococcus stummii TaxID=3028294 RepID=A0AA96V7D5_9EURY|nr:hypothetical protein [Methanimicrococcus sp. Es2]WNY28074.1 hypothetical protein MmiEs2_02540 [Methanimicrococcus sp. Es2]
MVRDARGIIKFVSVCFIAFLFLLAACIAIGTIAFVYSETAPSSPANVPVVIPVLSEPEYEEAETPDSISSIEDPAEDDLVLSSDTYTRTYSWTYGGYNQTITVSVPKEYYDYYRNKSHSGKDFDHYALSEDDRVFLGKMIESFKEQGEQCNFTADQNVLNIIAFVQAMPYTSDSVTTGYDEYPRYPIETLVDGGGDCEDSAILAAALLLEMNYGVVLIELPGHMALGVKGSENISGTYYTHNGDRYFYVETTASGYKLGEIPAEFKNASAKLYTMNPMPEIKIQLRADLIDSDLNYAYYKIHCDITNKGPTTASNVTALLFAESDPFDMTRVWSQSDAILVGTMVDEASGWAEYMVQVPRRNQTRFSCVVYGDNFNQVYTYTRVIYLN